MTRSPRVDSARRFFRSANSCPDAKSGFHRPARLAHAVVTVGFGLAVSCTGGLAQNAAKGSADHIKAVTSAVDSASIRANTATSKDWPTYGLDYAETRFSKLDQINADNVKNLGLMWSYNLESIRGVEATPVVVDGIMYVTASWSVVHAVDARTGKRIWSFDPGVDREKGYKGCALQGHGFRRRLRRAADRARRRHW
jgi:quinohemoprotein ethanol dehydrogenase